MQNLVQAWLIRVERLTADIDRKRAHLEEVRSVSLGLQASEQEKERLLASALYISSFLSPSVMHSESTHMIASKILRRMRARGMLMTYQSREHSYPIRSCQLARDAEGSMTELLLKLFL